MRVVGIDPGLKGALAVAEIVEGRMTDTRVADMPTIEFVDGRLVPDPLAILDLLRDFRPNLIILEHVEPRPRAGATSEWRFASGFGATIAACQLHFGRSNPGLHLVRPALWKAKLGVTSDKATSLNLAKKIFPSMEPRLSRAKDDGRAEALLLIEYYRSVLIPAGEMEVI